MGHQAQPRSQPDPAGSPLPHLSYTSTLSCLGARRATPTLLSVLGCFGVAGVGLGELLAGLAARAEVTPAVGQPSEGCRCESSRTEHTEVWGEFEVGGSSGQSTHRSTAVAHHGRENTLCCSYVCVRLSQHSQPPRPEHRKQLSPGVSAAAAAAALSPAQLCGLCAPLGLSSLPHPSPAVFTGHRPYWPLISGPSAKAKKTKFLVHPPPPSLSSSERRKTSK